MKGLFEPGASRPRFLGGTLSRRASDLIGRPTLQEMLAGPLEQDPPPRPPPAGRRGSRAHTCHAADWQVCSISRLRTLPSRPITFHRPDLPRPSRQMTPDRLFCRQSGFVRGFCKRSAFIMDRESGTFDGETAE